LWKSIFFHNRWSTGHNRLWTDHRFSVPAT